MKKYTSADRLNQLMREYNYRQVDILNKVLPYAKKYNVKMNKSDISQYLSGKHEPYQDKLYVLAEAFNVNESWLMGFDVPRERLNRETETLSNDYTSNENIEKAVTIPILGRVAAGIPIEAITDIIDYEEISGQLARTGDFFGLLIKGDSMEPEIHNGDNVIVRKQPDVDSGEVAIVMVNGQDATCKRIIKEENGILLQPINSSHTPKFYTKEQIETIPVTILGRVMESRRKF